MGPHSIRRGSLTHWHQRRGKYRKDRSQFNSFGCDPERGLRGRGERRATARIFDNEEEFDPGSRMNAAAGLTCKSRASWRSNTLMATGARVRNAYGTYPPQGITRRKADNTHGSPTLPGVGGKTTGGGGWPPCHYCWWGNGPGRRWLGVERTIPTLY